MMNSLFRLLFITVFIMSICSCDLKPDNGLRAKSYDYQYTINWSVNGRDAYFDICDINYCVVGTKEVRSYSSANNVMNITISYNSEMDESPYIVVYSNDGVSSEKKFLGVYKTSGKKETCAMTLSKIGNSATFIGLNQISVSWNWQTTYSDVKYVIKGYHDDGVSVIETKAVNTTELTAQINSHRKYDITLNLWGHNIYLLYGNAI